MDNQSHGQYNVGWKYLSIPAEPVKYSGQGPSHAHMRAKNLEWTYSTCLKIHVPYYPATVCLTVTCDIRSKMWIITPQISLLQIDRSRCGFINALDSHILANSFPQRIGKRVMSHQVNKELEWIYKNIDIILKWNKSDVKRRHTLGCLDQYTCRGFRLWNSRDREVQWSRCTKTRTTLNDYTSII